MQAIQLYIKNTSGDYERLTMFDDESVSVVQSIKNVRDISKIFTTFSRQFTVPADKVNNRIFKHYYNYDIENGFDARIRKDAKIDLNYLPFKDGKIRLDGVDMRSNKPFAYRITFFGKLTELKDILGEDKLFSLNALQISFEYGAGDIKDNLLSLHATDSQNNVQTGISLPLITHSQRLYYDSANESEQSGNLYWGTKVQGVMHRQLKYAVRLDRIIDAIESQYSQINFATDSFFHDATKDIHKIYMWCHRKTGQVTIEAGNEQKVPFTQTNFQTYFNINTSGNAVPVNNAASNETLWFVASVDTNSKGEYDLIIKKNGDIVQFYEKVSGTVSPTFTTGAFASGDQYAAYIRTYDEPIVFTGISWKYYQDTTAVQTESVGSGGLTYPSSYKFNIKDNMPDMKIMDFLSGLFKMFNLVAYVQDDDTIQVQPLDDYYTTTEHDITKYIDVDTSAVDSALPFREIFFKYEDTQTILANQHFQEISDVEWGGDEYTDTGNLDGEIYSVIPPFHHAKYEKLLDNADLSVDTGIQVGYFVNETEETYLGKPLLLYINNQSPNVDMSFVANTNRIQISSTQSVNMPSNNEDIDNDTSNTLHFDVERSEYTYNELNSSLFSRFYQNYIENVFNSKNRLTKVSAVLPIGKIINIELSDIIVIGGRKYRINTMDTNLKDGRTQFELINYYD